MHQKAWFFGAASGLWATMGSASASVAPQDRAIDLLPAATEVMRDIREFHGFLLAIIVPITVLVLALLLWVIVRYNRRANPTPRKFTHNLTVELIWTIVPVLILVAIAWKSFPLIVEQEQRRSDAELTLKVVGNSWFWSFEYPDLGVQGASILLPEADARAQDRPWLLAVDNPIYVPIDTDVRLLITSNDVIHSFALPAAGVKEDAIQGRVNEAWFNIDEPGTYYGQCSELCGKDHAFMPIEVRAVSRAEFEQWVSANGGAFADAAPAAPAAAEPGAAPTGAPTR